MVRPDYNSSAALKSFMEEQGMAMQKRFGQNFMINPSARSAILDSLECAKGDSVWEIGPGLGSMTSGLLDRGMNVTAFEIDRGFIGCLHSFFEDYEKQGTFSIIEGDVLKNWEKEYREGVTLFGNLPYNIAATFVADTITAQRFFKKCVFTVQKEVAQRMASKPSSKNYSAYSVLCQWAYDVRTGLELAPGNFWPKPNVASQCVIMDPKEQRPDCGDPKLFVSLVHALFASRRKTIANNIKPLLPAGSDAADIITSAGVQSSERAENLTVEQLAAISRSLKNAKNK